jgi:CBS domain containing-hemolysin-like protein
MVSALPGLTEALRWDFEGSVVPLPLALAILLLALAGFGSHVASALLAYSPTKLQRRLREPGAGEPPDPISKEALEYQIIARTLAIAGLLGSLLSLQVAVTGSLTAWATTAFIAIGVLFCGLLPSLVAARHAEALLVASLPLLRVLRLLLHYPLVVPLRLISRAALRLLRIPEQPTTDAEEITEEILAAVTDTTADTGLQAKPKLWIENIIELQDLDVASIMTPRTDIAAFPASLPLRTAIGQAIEGGHSRYPIYDGTIDNVIGMLYVRDALAWVSTAGPEAEATVELLGRQRQPLFVPESMKIHELLERFRASRVQTALVLDEYGGTAGLVTHEDVFAQIVGDIRDQVGESGEKEIEIVEDHRVLEISGRVRIEQVNDLLGVEIPTAEEYETIGGYVFAHLGKIPRSGESFTAGNLEFRILRADERRIARLRVTVLVPHQPAP